MSRIGNKAVEIPDKVKVNIGADGAVAVEGPKGKLSWSLPREIKASVKDNRDSRDRQKIGRTSRGGHPQILSAGAVQGQRCALCGRANPAQGRKDGSIVMARSDRKEIRHRIHTRIRKRVSGTAERPRLAVHF